MSYNGSGTFVLYTPGNPVVTGTTISSTWANSTLSDIATGLSTAITKDGQTTPTANIPLGGYKLTGVGAATARTDAATLANIQDGTGVYVATVGGTADAITLTPSPAITAYAAGQRFSFIAGANNTGAATVAISGLTAKSITKNGATALAAADIVNTKMTVIEYDGTQFQLINAPSTASGSITASGYTMSTARMLGRITASTGAIEELTSTQVTTNFVDAASDTAAGKIEVADQTEMEAGSSTTLAVTPGRQQFHPSAVKFWLKAAGDGSTINASYNVTSISDFDAGTLGVTIATDFSSANWCCHYSTIDTNQRSLSLDNSGSYGSAQAAGSCITLCIASTGPANRADPASHFVSGMGDQ